MNTNALCWFFLLFLYRGVLSAQEVPEVKKEYLLIRASDGNTYVGRALRVDSAEVVLETELFPELVLPRSSIRRMRPVSVNRLDRRFFTAEIPVSGSYFFGASAHGLPVGEAYIHNGLLFIHRAAAGLSENFSIRGHLLMDVDQYNLPMLLAPKISLPVFNNRITLALEGLIGRGMQAFTEDGNSDFSAFHSLITVGSRHAHLTVGSGLSWTNGRWARHPFFSVSGAVPLAGRWAFLSENYFFRYYGEASHAGAFGFRLLSSKINVELGVIFFWQEEIIYVEGFPWLGFSLNLY